MSNNYIQRRDENGLETVDQIEGNKEARRVVGEYRMADPYAEYYISQRACKDWHTE